MKNAWFASIGLAIFGVASRWLNDPRVLPQEVADKAREGDESDEGGRKEIWTLAGWGYIGAAMSESNPSSSSIMLRHPDARAPEIHEARRSVLLPPELFEIQSFAVSSTRPIMLSVNLTRFHMFFPRLISALSTMLHITAPSEAHSSVFPGNGRPMRFVVLSQRRPSQGTGRGCPPQKDLRPQAHGGRGTLEEGVLASRLVRPHRKYAHWQTVLLAGGRVSEPIVAVEECLILAFT